jgi:PKD repeat protein
MLRIVLITFFLISSVGAYAQTAGFSASSSVCLNEQVSIVNSSSGATNYLWDFCNDGLLNPKSTTTAIKTVPSNIPVGIETVYDQGNWYGFICGRDNASANKLIRLSFGNSLSNTPIILQDYDASINSSFNGISEIKFAKVNGNWFGFTANFNSNNVVRIDFGTSIGNNNPTVTNLGNAGSWSGLYGLDIINNNGTYILVAVGNASNTIAFVNYGTTIYSPTPIVSSITTINNSSNSLINSPVKIAAQNDNGNWYVLFSSLAGKVVLLQLGNTPENGPTAISSVADVPNASALQFKKDGANFFGFSQNSNGDLYRLNFGSTINTSPTTSSLGNFGGVGNVYGLSVVKEFTEWKAFFVGVSSNVVHRLDFQDKCTGDVSILTSTDVAPTGLHYAQSGTKYINLTAFDALDNYDVALSTVTVQNLIGPSLSISTTNNCLSSAVNISAIESSGQAISSYSWNFGDGNLDNSNSQVVNHTYNSVGDYQIKLTATAQNTCTAAVTKSIAIYNPPTANFDLPSGTTCTNNNLLFSNTSVYDNVANISWKWFVDDVEVSTVKDLSRSFLSSIGYQIKLRATIPGCDSEVTKPISLNDGPTVNFTYTNNCFGSAVKFADETIGSGLTGSVWTFGDGATASNIDNPQHQYSTSGSYAVKLVVNNSQGCANEKSILLGVNDQPLADFTSTSAIENLPITFTGQDLTSADDQVSVWNWDFNSFGQKQGSPVNFSFSSTGAKTIVLSGTTIQGCAFSVQKNLNVGASTSPSVSISINNTACREENINIINNTVNASSYSWDFCHEDLKSISSTKAFVTIPAMNVPEGIDVVFEKGNYYSFVTSRDNNKIFRMDLGTDVSEPSPSNIIDLGATNLSAPMDIRLAKQSDIWFGFVINSGSGKITRFRFGNGIDSAPDEITDIGNFGKLEPGIRGFDLVFDGTNWIAGVVNFENSKIVIVNLGSDISSINGPVSSLFSSPLINGPIGVSLIKGKAEWHALVSSFNSSSIVNIDFGNNFLTVPSSSSITSVATVPAPFEIQVVKEGLNYFGHAISSFGNLYFLNFGTDLSAQPVSPIDKGNFSNLLANTVAFKIFRTAPNWKGLVVDYFNKKISKISFSGICNNMTTQTSTNFQPQGLEYLATGNYAIELSAVHQNGNIVTETKSVSVSSSISPMIDITGNDNQCLGVMNTFVSLPGNLTSYSWSFGDDASDNTNSPSVAHQYATAGGKEVGLTVIAQNGCQNILRKTINIFNPPTAVFTLPSSPHCTNQLYTFANTSSFDVGSNPSWQWFVDNQQVTTAKDLEFAFTNTTDASVKLIASIPGCPSTATQQMTSLIAGPVVDFAVAGKCDQEQIQFASNISQPVTSLSWSFGDGNTNANDNPKNLYASPGQYTVVLSTVSPSGCNNSKTKTVTIFSNPKADFLVEGAPNSCTSAETKFTNQTPTLSDTEVISWLWSFSPGLSGTSIIENPSYQFSSAGDYNVSLKATTKEGCVGTVQKTIPILQGPTATISNTPSCVGVPINFSATGSGLDSYYWEMGSSYYTTPIANHTFNLAGTYNSKLTITSANNCQLTLSKQLVVPAVLAPDFSVKQNCVGYDAQLTDLTTGNDPVVRRDWDILGFPSKTGSPVSYNFSSATPRSVKLTVKSQAGCSYSKTKTINVVAAPEANFSVDPQSGGVPLISQFTNTSINSTSFIWKFGDGKSESTLNSPSFTFTNVGEFSVELAASNAEGCESKASKIISALSPIDDVEIKVINYTTNPDGSLKVIVTLQNNGNTILRNLTVDIDVSGITTLREIVPGPITPSTLYNLVLGSTFTVPEKLSFFCASSLLTNDVTPENNRACKELGEKISLLDSYPNPVKSSLFVNWIAPENETMTVEIVDLFGKTVLSVSLTSTEGLNEYIWNTEHVENGLYILKIKGQSVSKTERILIAR